MKYYIELRLLETQDININFLMNKIYGRIHLLLVKNKKTDNMIDIGISFPDYSKKEKRLGRRIRLLSESEESLKNLELEKNLRMFKDYAIFSGIKAVPKQINSHSIFKRLQVKTNPERLARRKAKRENISMSEALKKYKDFKAKQLELPYIQLKSYSNNNDYRLYINKVDKKTDNEYLFNTYGLSNSVSVPNF